MRADLPVPLQGDFPGSHAGRAFARLATRLLSQHGTRGQVVVTSPERKAGRTTVAANLSLALRIQGVDVLLLELTEQPALEATFGVSPLGSGVEKVLQGRERPDNIVCKRADSGLHLMVIKQKFALQLERESKVLKLRSLLDYAKKYFSWTVIDGPLGTDVESVTMLAGQVSQTIIVAGRRSTTHSRLRDLAISIEQYSPYMLLNNE